MDEYVVTATCTEQDIQKVPANISVVKGEDVRDKHYTDMTEVLRDTSNVYIGNYASGVGYAGSNAFYINGSKNVVWMVDGIEMNAKDINAPLVVLKF